MDTVNVLVMAPILGDDLSFVAEVDPRVRVLDGNAAYAAELEAQGARSLTQTGPVGDLPSVDERNALLADADVLLISHPVLNHIASRAPRLKWVHHTQAGVSNLLNSDVWNSEIALTSSRGFVATAAIAQYAFAGILYFSRGLFDASLDKLSGEIDRSHYQTPQLADSTVGIVGLGGIGRELARIARFFSMRTIATRRSAKSPQRNVDGADLILPADNLLEMAAQSDFLVVCTQLTQETVGLIDRRIIEAMKPGSVLINVSRGDVVDEIALVSGLENGRIRGAVLDVFQGELEGLPPKQELMQMPQVLINSHASSHGADFVELVRGLFRDNLRRFLDGDPLVNLVDRSRGY